MSEYFTCTKDNPHTKEKWKGRVCHPDAVELSQEDGYPGGDIIRNKCPNCGVEWKEELPQ